MTDAACTPLKMIGPTVEREQRADRLAELLECMADLLVETRQQRVEIERHAGSDDPRVREAITGLTQLEGSLAAVGVETASVHQQLQHVHLV
jgi:hypothetical protein